MSAARALAPRMPRSSAEYRTPPRRRRQNIAEHYLEQVLTPLVHGSGGGSNAERRQLLLQRDQVEEKLRQICLHRDNSPPSLTPISVRQPAWCHQRGCFWCPLRLPNPPRKSRFRGVTCYRSYSSCIRTNQ
jgi:hypothetical protein